MGSVSQSAQEACMGVEEKSRAEPRGGSLSGDCGACPARVCARSQWRRKGQGAYLLLDVLERVGVVDGEADEDDMGVGVGKGTQTIVVLLACGKG